MNEINRLIDFQFKKVKRWEAVQSLTRACVNSIFWGKSYWLVASCSRAQLCCFSQLLGHRSWTSEMSLCRLRWWELKEIIPCFTWEPFEDDRPYLVFARVLWSTHIPPLSWLLLWSQFHDFAWEGSSFGLLPNPVAALWRGGGGGRS